MVACFRLRGGYMKVLILEDEPDIRDVFVMICRSAGHTVIEAKNLKEARAAFDKEGDEIDTYIMDHSLPDGLSSTFYREIEDRIRIRVPPVKVITMTGGNSDAIGFYRSRGITIHIKPFNPYEVLKSLLKIGNNNSRLEFTN